MDQSTPASVNGNPVHIRIWGHFGELIQGRLGSDGPIALVTLPCPALRTKVCFTPGGRLRTAGADAPFARDLAARLLETWAPGTGGLLEIERPAAVGLGAGSSTAELLGVVRAIALHLGRSLTPEQEARLCHSMEGAVDPLMYDQTVLFASRQPQVLETLPALPPFQVIGGFAGPGQRTDPQDTAFPDVTAAVAQLRSGLIAGDLQQIADAARTSAEANQVRNPNPAWDGVLRIGADTGALGPVVSHTGSAIGLILPIDTPSTAVESALRALKLAPVMVFDPTGQ